MGSIRPASESRRGCHPSSSIIIRRPPSSVSSALRPRFHPPSILGSHPPSTVIIRHRTQTLSSVTDALASAPLDRSFQPRSASDAVLHVLATTSGYSTVGRLVLVNADYVIDSVCRQLRHLDLNPHIPSVLASMLSYIGVAQKGLRVSMQPPLIRFAYPYDSRSKVQLPDRKYKIQGRSCLQRR